MADFYSASKKVAKSSVNEKTRRSPSGLIVGIFAYRVRALAAALLVTLVIVGSFPNPAGSQTNQRSSDRSSDMLSHLSGNWVGTSTSDIHASSVKITLQIRRQGSELKGQYRCAPGNTVCRNNIDHGKIHGVLNSRGFDVVMDDNSRCTYFVEHAIELKADGEYTCYSGDAIVDRGIFDVNRTSTDHHPSRHVALGSAPKDQ